MRCFRDFNKIQNCNILGDFSNVFVAENEAFSTNNAHSARRNRFLCVSTPHRSYSATQSAGNDGKKSIFTFSKYCRVKKHWFTGKNPNIDFSEKKFQKFEFFWLVVVSNYHKHIFQWRFEVKNVFSRDFYLDFGRF